MQKKIALRWLKSLSGLLLLFVVSGCPSGPDMEFVSAGVDEMQETVPVPPTLKELHAQKSNIAFLPIQYSDVLGVG